MDDARAGCLLREVARLHFQLQRNEVAVCCDTTSTQCHILTELDGNGPLTLVELVRRLNVDKGWPSRTVEAMAQEGLLEKVAGAIDKRTIVISLTAAVNQTLNTHSGRVLLRIPQADRAQVYRALELLSQALHNEQVGEPITIQLEADSDERDQRSPRNCC